MSTTEKAVNYTSAMVARMKELAPLNLEKAELLAAEFGGGKTAKSVIAKAKREQIEYITKPAPTKKPKDAPTKAQLVALMQKASGMKLDQLDKAPTATLNELARWMSKMLESETDVSDSAPVTE